MLPLHHEVVQNNKIIENQSRILQSHGLKSSGFTFPCIHADCTERFRFRTNLYEHLVTHSKSKRCPYCRSEFGGWNILVDHVYEHTGHQPYICPLIGCMYTTRAKHSLKQHLLCPPLSTKHELSASSPVFAYDFIFHDFLCSRGEMSPQVLSLVLSLDRLECWLAEITLQEQRASYQESLPQNNCDTVAPAIAPPIPPLQHEVVSNINEPLRKRRRLIDDQPNMDINPVSSTNSNPSSNDGERTQRSIENENQRSLFISKTRTLCAQKANSISSAISPAPRMSTFDHLKSSRMTDITKPSPESQSTQDYSSKMNDNDDNIAKCQSQILRLYGLKSTGFLFLCIYPDCLEQFRFTINMTNHLRIVHNGNLHCPHCGTASPTLSSLMHHAYFLHTEKPYVCPVSKCDFAAGSKGHLKYHLQSRLHELSTFVILLHHRFDKKDSLGFVALHIVFPETKYHRGFCLSCYHWTDVMNGPKMDSLEYLRLSLPFLHLHLVDQKLHNYSVFRQHHQFSHQVLNWCQTRTILLESEADPLMSSQA